MTHIELNAQGEAVKQFFLSLPPDPEGTLVEVNGRAVARLTPLPPGDNGQPGGERRWTSEKNLRRGFLIDRKIDGTLTLEESQELDILQHQMTEHLDLVCRFLLKRLAGFTTNC